MNTYVPPRQDHSPISRVTARLRDAEAWLDARGKGAWIALLVVSMIAAWPLGLALLAYMIWSRRMFRTCSSRRERNTQGFAGFRAARTVFTPSGNSAFDAYKADTIARLEREQEEFGDFLRRLREARDKAEFDTYMAERGDETTPAAVEGEAGRA